MSISKKYQKIFITGGAGFIGSHFADALVAEKRQVIVFDNLSSGKMKFLEKSLTHKNFKFIKGDLLNQGQISRAIPKDTDLVIHLAANPDISKGIKDPSLDFNQTIMATFNLLQEIKIKGIKNIVYFSGSGVYGDAGDTFTSESYGPLLPVSMYGASKLGAEGLISAFSNLFDIRAWIFRPANIIGDRATHGVIFDFINKLKKNPSELVILGDGKQSKSYIYISDVLNAVFLALKNTNKNRINIYNIASKSFINVNEIAECVIEAMRLKKVNIVHTKGKIGWVGDVAIVRIDSKKIRDIGWNEKFTSEMAVEKTSQDLLMEK
ncbi:MAG TPA: NAD-dependent epimerase/dehydratase family protein [Candidatus Paceibacterota bacterium]